MSGTDGQDLLRRMSTNDLSPLSDGIPLSTILTSEKGRIIDVLSVIRLDRQRLLLIGQSFDTAKVIQWLEKFIIMEDIRIDLLSESYSHLLLYGNIEDVEVPENYRRGNSLRPEIEELNGALGPGPLVYSDAWGSVVFSHILFGPSHQGEIENWLKEHRVRRTTRDDFEHFRIRNGVPASPNELSESYNPLEANLKNLVSWTKGCYIGQEVIARLETYKKVQRKLMRVEMEEPPSSLPVPLYSPDGDAGILTSVSVDPSDQGTYGLAYVRIPASQGNGAWYLNSKGERVAVIFSAV